MELRAAFSVRLHMSTEHYILWLQKPYAENYTVRFIRLFFYKVRF